MSILYEDVFGTSAEKSVSATKIRTTIGCFLFNEAHVTNIEGTTQRVGTKISVATTLYDENGVPLNGKSVDIYHRLNTGTPEKIRTVIIGTTSDEGKPASGGAHIWYTLAKSGKHTFYAVFAGDDTYEGCSQEVKAFAKPTGR